MTTKVNSYNNYYLFLDFYQVEIYTKQVKKTTCFFQISLNIVQVLIDATQLSDE